MSTIKVTNIEHGSTSNGGIQLDSSGHVTIDGQQLPTTGALSNRNLIINGAMQVAQRGTSATGVTASAYNTVDRFRTFLGNLGTYTVTQESDGPSGFTKSLKYDCTTADASPAASDFFLVFYSIEAQDLQHLSYGSSDALPMTLTFYVKSNKTGNASLEVEQRDNASKRVTLQYTINAADTWEKKTLSIPGDTAGLINNDNGEGLRLGWWLNSGSTYTGGSHQTTWTAANNADRNPSNLGIGGSTNDSWQITGVQLEVGEKATPFEHRSYGADLVRCQRYHQESSANSAGTYSFLWSGDVTNANTYYVGFPLPTAMRATPTVTLNNVADSRFNISTITAYPKDEQHLVIGCLSDSTGARGYFEGSYVATAEF